jgi:outer membrane murein-binding lipoprotein Lpp
MAPAPAVSDALRGTVDQLGARLRSLEDAVNRLSQQPPGFGADAGVSEAVVQQLQQQLQTLNATVNAILAAMQNTVGFRAHDTFICSDCQTQGFVAARLNCTACGKDNWWGWWPPPQ